MSTSNTYADEYAVVTSDTKSYKEDLFSLINLDQSWSREDTIKFYNELRLKLPHNVRNSMNLLTAFMTAGKLPAFYPPLKKEYERQIKGKGSFHMQLLALNPYSIAYQTGNDIKFECSAEPEAAQYINENKFNWVVDCVKHKNCPASSEARVVIGGKHADIVHCPWYSQLYWLGSGNDEIDDSWGNDIINAGEGDDQVDAGHGADIIIYENNWGKDTLDQSCKYNNFNIDLAVDSSAKKFWKNKEYKYTNFILFGLGIYPEDMKWVEPHILKNVKTEDQITFKNRPCFNLVFFENGETTALDRFNWLEFYKKL